ncbi:hypothetical protein CR513_52046, partial [Mucuna pruriens]
MDANEPQGSRGRTLGEDSRGTRFLLGVDNLELQNANYSSSPLVRREIVKKRIFSFMGPIQWELHDCIIERFNLGEDLDKHLKEFHVVCSTMKPHGILEEYIKMKAFPSSLDGAT